VTTVASDRRDLFGRAARAVGDLDHPFYAEERQREVWNEASAVGMQTMLWGSAVLACAMTWLGGGELLPWAVALLGLVGAASWFMVAYANRQGVSGFEGVRVARPRTFVFLALYVATIAGAVVRGGVSLDGSTSAGVAAGLLAGALAGGAALVAGRRRASRSEPGEG
jgi:hypothetical protein